MTGFLSASSDDAARIHLNGRSLLYVGGRANQISHIRSTAERLGGTLHHHDGGIDDRNALLAGLVSQADLALFPVDCISHAAMLSLKKLCQHAGKRCIPLRNASLTCFIAALSAVIAE